MREANIPNIFVVYQEVSHTDNQHSAIVGKRVKIVATKFERHSDMIGKTGQIEKFIKSRGIYKIKLDEGGNWEAIPENLASI